MKISFAFVALGLLVSVLSGLSMAWRYSRRPRLFGAIFGQVHRAVAAAAALSGKGFENLNGGEPHGSPPLTCRSSVR